MPRTDTAVREIAVAPDRVYAAFVDEEALIAWLPPEGMTGAFEHFDPTPGGGYRMRLSYGPGTAHRGKTDEASDLVEARFVEIVAGERVVQEVDFVSDDSAFRGTMRMTWRVMPSDRGSRVEIRAENVPSGISAAEHAIGLASSLANLAAHLGEGGPAGGP
ncbi:SRPBCC domain-containing protein [Leucobacter sp. GX24907]